MARDIIFRQLRAFGASPDPDTGVACVCCAICTFPILENDETIWEHIWALALGGEDKQENIGLVHRECARKKTIGSGATTHGSDIGEITKTNRMEAKRLGTRKPRLKRKIPPRPFR